MSIFQRIQRGWQAFVEPNYTFPKWADLPLPNHPITHQTVLGLPAIHRCCRLVASTIAGLPCQVVRDTDGVDTPDTSHPLYPLLRYQPHSNYHAVNFFETLISNALTTGNG